VMDADITNARTCRVTILYIYIYIDNTRSRISGPSGRLFLARPVRRAHRDVASHVIRIRDFRKLHDRTENWIFFFCPALISSHRVTYIIYVRIGTTRVGKCADWGPRLRRGGGCCCCSCYNDVGRKWKNIIRVKSPSQLSRIHVCTYCASIYICVLCIYNNVPGVYPHVHDEV